MDIAILLQMSGIINACSIRYEANVPNTPVSYAKQVNGKLVNIKCHALQVKARGKHKNHLHRSFWLIYELDIDRIIRRISRHNAEMAKRVKEIALTVSTNTKLFCPIFVVFGLMLYVFAHLKATVCVSFAGTC